MSSHDDLGAVEKIAEEVARKAWDDAERREQCIEERIRAAVGAHLESNGWPGYEIIHVCKHVLPDGRPIYVIGEVLKTTFWKGQDRYQSIEIGHDLVLSDGEGFVILPKAAMSSKSEDADGQQ